VFGNCVQSRSGGGNIHEVDAHMNWSRLWKFLQAPVNNSSLTDEELRCFDNQAISKGYRARTAAGFKIHYTILATLPCVDPKAWEAAQMFLPGFAESVLAAWHDQILAPLMKRSFFTLDFVEAADSQIQPTVSLWLIIEKDGATKTLYDNGSLLCAAAQERDLQLKWQRNGSIVKLREIQCEVTDKDVEENSKMIDPELARQAEQDKSYWRVREAAAALAFKRQQDLEHEHRQLMERLEHERGQLVERLESQIRKQHMAGNGLAVDTYGQGTSQYISWKIGAHYPSGWEVLGFRKMGAFSNDPLSEIDNGALIIHGNADGSSVDQLEHGHTYFYTFILKNDRYTNKEWVRFSISMPSVAQQDTNPGDEELERLVASLTHNQQREQTIRDFRTKAVLKIENDTSLSPKERRERIRLLDESIVRVTNGFY
jgi:hypothetical protein